MLGPATLAILALARETLAASDELACALDYRPGALERGPDEGLASDVAALFERT